MDSVLGRFIANEVARIHGEGTPNVFLSGGTARSKGHVKPWVVTVPNSLRCEISASDRASSWTFCC